MIKGLVVRRTVISAAAVLVVLALALPCLAASFSGDVTLKSGPNTQVIKLYVNGDKMSRQETSIPRKMISILRSDKKMMLEILPEARQYREVRMRALPPKWNDPSIAKTLAKLATKKSMGKDTVNGYQCDKYQYTFKNKRMGVMTQWISPKLNYPIKQVNKAGGQTYSMEIRNIKEGSIPLSMFEAPKGYKKYVPKPRPATAPKPGK